jgi:tetratricopeptide (TPR) repeat protein
LAIASEMDNKYVPWFLFNLGAVALQHDGDPNRGKALFEESNALSRELGLTEMLAWNTAQLGHIARNSGDYERAAALYEESLAFARQFGDKYIIAYALRNMGVLALHTRNHARAAALLIESLGLCHAPNWVAEECLIGMAQIACIDGHYVRAARLFGAGDALREALGIRRLALMQARHDEVVAATRTPLGDAVFAAAWAEGRAMTLEQAIEYALAP